MEEKAREIIRGAAGILAGTRAVDATGNLLLLHHATNREFTSFRKSSDMGFHFGTRSQAEKRKANMIARGEGAAGDNWRFISCVLAVQNPLVVADDPGIWGPRWLTATFSSFLNDHDRSQIRSLAYELNARPHDSEVTARDRAILQEWFQVLVGSLKRAGHDGIVYRNIFENTTRSIEWSWMVFDDAQIVRMGDLPRNTVPAEGCPVGAPPVLRGARPMRDHQDWGMGPFVRKTDRNDFRKALEDWATASGIEWEECYPLDYEPEFGRCRPSHDLRAKMGSDSGFRIVVSSQKGEVRLQPFSRTETPSQLMSSFRSDASEGFFEHGLDSDSSDETLHWRPAETLEAFRNRLDAVFKDFMKAFPVEEPAQAMRM